jgi:AcrR family transcriptional regulator
MGVTERKEREKERRREDILDAAEKVFVRKGFDSATMDDVAESAELSKATIYLYFSSKEEIYFAIFLRGQRKLADMIRKENLSISDTREKLKAYLSAMIRFQKRYPKYFEAFYHFFTREVTIADNSIYRHEHEKTSRELFNYWIELVQKGKKEKLIRSDLNDLRSGAIMWIQLVGFLKIYPVMKKVMKKNYKVIDKEIMEDYFELTLSGVLRR